MGQCTIEAISGCRRKRRKSGINSSSSICGRRREQGAEENPGGNCTSRGTAKGRRGGASGGCCLFVILIILLSFPVAIRGSSGSLDPNNNVEIAPRTQLPVTTSSGHIHHRDSSSFFYLSSPSGSSTSYSTSTPFTKSDSIGTSSSSVALESVAEQESYLSSISTEPLKYYLSSSSTPSGRAIRSSSAHSVTPGATTPQVHAKSSITSASAVTEPIRVTATLPEHHRGHQFSHNSNHQHEGVHPKPVLHSRGGGGKEREEKEEQKQAPKTLQEICAAWEEKGCKCSGSAEEIQLNCRGVISFDAVPFDLPDNLVKL